MTAPETVVFIIDDDPSVRRSLERLLKSVGIGAESFATAKEFLNRGHWEEPGCLILDVRMPEISGFDLPALYRLKHGIGMKIYVIPQVKPVFCAIRINFP